MLKKVILSALGAYTVTSYILFKNPSLLHKKKRFAHDLLNTLADKPGEKVLSIAHRGGSYEKIENTIESFQNAVDNGTELLEMDLQMTKDDVIVVCHDVSLLRLCGVNVKVSDLNYNELPKFAQDIHLDHFDNTILDTRRLSDTKIPTLEEVFQKFPNTLIQLDLKGGSRDITQKTSELIKRYNREKLTIWGAMGDDQYLREFNPDLDRFFSPFAVIKTYGLYITGLLPFVPITSKIFSIPKYSTHYEKWKSSKGGVSVSIYFALFRFMESISKPLIKHLQERGVLVFHWVLNEDADFEESLKFNINGIMTDKPTQLKKFLEDRGKKL